MEKNKTIYHNVPLEIKNNKILFKGVLVIVILTSVFLNCKYGFSLPDDDVKCIVDVSHIYTENINTYLHNNKHIANWITLLSSLCIDIIMISISVHWVIKGRSWRFWICLGLFYLFRGICQNIFIMRYPHGFLWDYPGIPSLAVSYLKTSDFFFSGHVGLPIIAACEFFKNKKNFLGSFAVFGSLFEFVVMMIMRGHYIIDLIFGIIVGHYIFILVDTFIHLLDNSFLTLKESKTVNFYKKVFKEKDRDDSIPDCKASTSSSDDINKFY